jgi:hypothetical protein
MADFHILSQSNDLKTVTCAFHITVPDINNSAGISYRTALVISGVNETQVGNLTTAYPAEVTALANGSLLEVIETIRFSILGLNNTQKLAEIETAYTNRQAQLLADKQVELAFTGYAADVA